MKNKHRHFKKNILKGRYASLKYFVIFIILISYCFKFDSKALDIPIIVIAPNKSPQSYSTVGSSVSIIDQETISNSNNFFLVETLDKNLPGMNYFRSGGYGSISGIQLRGLPKDIQLFILMELKCQIHLLAIIVSIFQI